MPFVRRAALAVFFLCLISVSLHAQQPISGQPVSVFAPVDTIMENLMSQYSSPGSAVAISYNGKLVYARGYGYAEVETNNPVQPDTIMRWASNSKPITAIGIYNLIQAGKLKLTDQPFVTIFTDLAPPSGTTYNTELNQITIQDLLLHEGGWDDTEVPDPVFEYEDTAAQALGDAVPATPKELIEYMMSQPLQHSPGTTYAYSNLGYIILGQVISKVSAGNYTSYESYMQTNILNNTHGLGRMQPTGTFLDQQLPNEAAYYDYPGAPLVTNVYDPNGTDVPYQYGGYSLPLNHANGGWAGAAMDVVREWDIMNGQITPAIITNPDIEVNLDSSVGVYFPTAPVGKGYTYTFYGSLPGTNSLVHMDTTTTYGGELTFGAVFNTRNGSNIEEPESDATNQIAQALLSVKSWPSGDLFTTYPGPGSACSFKLSSSSASVTAAAGSGSTTMTDANYCAWLSTSNDSWITVTAGAMNSNSGTLSYSVAANTGATRTGTITITGPTSPLTFTITQAGPTQTATTTALTITPNPLSVGQSATITATVAKSSGSGTPTGKVVFTVEGETIATVTLNGSGVAKLTQTTNGLQPGSYPVIASYDGDSNDKASKSSAVTVKLNAAATATTLTASPNPVTRPGSITLTATVARSASGSAGTPTGKVTFTADGETLETVTVNGSGVATLTATTGSYGAGTYNVVAKYAGDTADTASTSTTLKVTLK